MKICIFGAASYEIDKSYIEAVEKLGETLAKLGHELVFGAGANGLMGASARGFTKGGGKICGIIPHFFKNEYVEAIYDKCDELIFTDTMAERKAKMEDLAEAFIVVPGGIGTFEEFFEVLTLKQLGRHSKPIVIYNINNYFYMLEKFIDFSINKEFINDNCKSLYGIESTPEKVIEYIMNDEQKDIDVHEMKKG